MSAKSPLVDTLWQRCFWEVHDECVAAGREEVIFAVVDARVATKAQLPIEELINFIQGDTTMNLKRLKEEFDLLFLTYTSSPESSDEFPTAHRTVLPISEIERLTTFAQHASLIVVPCKSGDRMTPMEVDGIIEELGQEILAREAAQIEAAERRELVRLRAKYKDS